jgi:hypothetical protein
MEILEMPVAEELNEETPQWGDAAPVKFEEQALDIAAFKLWQEASRTAAEES